MKSKLILILGTLLIVSIVLGLYFNESISIGSKDLKRFSSYDELASYVNESNKENYGFRTDSEESVFTPESASVTSTSGAKSDSVAFANDYSATNIQVIGVDEPDTVKNDGKYIYKVNGNKVYIIQAYPADSAKIISELKFDNYVNGIFVDKNRLVVIESSYGYYGGYTGPEIAVSSTYEKAVSPEEGLVIPEPSPMNDPQPGIGKPSDYEEVITIPENYGSSVKIHVYDIEDNLILNPELLDTFTVEGNYYTARLIEGNVYVVSNKYIGNSEPVVPFFGVGEDVEIADASRIYYPGYYQSDLMFTSVMAIDISSLKYEGDVFLTGTSNSIYFSKDSIFLTSAKPYDYSKINIQGELEIYSKILSGSAKSEAEEILDSDTDYYSKSQKLSLVVQEYFNGLDDYEKKDFEDSYSDASKSYYSEISKEYEKTLIHKIRIDGLDVDYDGVGEVPGYVLNQFSMDEYEGNFRIATTTGNIFGSFQNSLNHVYILDDGLEIVGSVENLASGERIYSARFLGDKAYMVTFRQIDPLYVIDLSNPKSPEVLGYLKVTGFSNYLHPIGDNLLMGIGREVTLDGKQKGLKISIFDVSDFENPKEIDNYVVESDSSYSEAEYEHKAVLFDDEKDLLVIPVSYNNNINGRDWEYWQGAFVFTVTDEDVSLKGKIDHTIEVNKGDGVLGADVEPSYYGVTQGYVSRSLFIEDVLYTISDYLIKANSLLDLKEIKSVKLDFTEPIYTIYGTGTSVSSVGLLD